MTPADQDFRAWARAHHPDVGGDPAEFVAGLGRWRRAAGGRRVAEVTVFRSGWGGWLFTRWVMRRRRTTRRVL